MSAFEKTRDKFQQILKLISKKWVEGHEKVTKARLDKAMPVFVSIGEDLDFSEMETKEMFANGTMDAIEERLP